MPKPEKGDAAPESAEQEFAHDIMAGAVNDLGAKFGIKWDSAERNPEVRRKDQGDEGDEKQDAEAEETDAEAEDKKADADADAEAEAEETDAEAEEKETDADAEAEAEETDAEAADKEPYADAAEKAEKDPAAEALAQEHAALVNSRLKDLPKEIRGRVQSILDSRIGAIVKKTAEEKSALEARVTELAGELEETRVHGGAPVIVPGVNPLFLAESDAAIDKRVEAIEAFEDWADQNKDGYEGDGTAKDPSYTAEQIRTRLRELHREKEKIVPAARANLQTRGRIDASLRQVYPQIFDPKSADYSARQRILKAMPEVRRFADMNAIVLQQILGERALTELIQKATKAVEDKKKGKGSETTPPRRKAPRAPGASGTAKGSVVVHQRTAPAAPEAVKKFTENRTRANLTDAVAALVPDL